MVNRIAPNSPRRDQSFVPNTVRDKEPNSQWEEDFFVYSADVADLDVAAATTFVINIQADSYFKWIKTTYYGFGVGENPEQTQATRIILPISMQVTDLGSGRQLFDRELPLSLVCGEGDLPFILPLPRVFLPRSSIQLSFTNFGSEDWDFQVALIGVKGFRTG